MGLRKESDNHNKLRKSESALDRSNQSDNQSSNESKSKNRPQQKQTPIKDKTKDGLSKGVSSYKEELENDDYGVESTGKMLEQTSKKSSSGISKINDHRKKQQANKPKKSDGKSANDYQKNQQANKPRKADEEHINTVKNKLEKDTRNKPKHRPSNSSDGKRDNFLKKVMLQPKEGVSAAKNKGAEAYKETLESDDQGVEIGSKSSKLLKDGSKSLSHTKKVRGKGKASKKLKEPTTKLKTDQAKKSSISPISQNQKLRQKKKIMRNSIDGGQNKNQLTSAIASMSKKTGLSVSRKATVAKKALASMFRKIIGTQIMSKIIAGAGALFTSLSPVLIVLGIVIAISTIVMAMAGGGGGEEEIEQQKEMKGQLDSEVLDYKDLVENVADEKGMSDYVYLILAIIQVESGGTGTKDIMQSSESAGKSPNAFDSEKASVEQGVSFLKEIVSQLDEKYKDSTKLIAQTYNFGLGFAGYINSGDYDGYSVPVAEDYSKSTVAVSLGNTTGETYEYRNSISEKHDKPYLYKNGGNFFYGEMVAQYENASSGGNVGDGGFAPPVPQPLYVTSPFGNRVSPGGGIGTSNHQGIDLNCTGGSTAIRAAKDGTVVKSRRITGMGNGVVIKHASNLYTTYGHMSSLTVSEGEKVSAGDQVGVCGSTGNSTDPHLHFELSPQPHKNQVDPQPYLKEFIGG